MTLEEKRHKGSVIFICAEYCTSDSALVGRAHGSSQGFGYVSRVRTIRWSFQAGNWCSW